MENHNIMIVALHDKPDSIEDCIKLLNDEWPRSKTARFGFNKFSVWLVSKISFEPASCMIESGKIMLVRECKSSQSKTSFGSSDKSSQQRKGFW